jgi:hypothetical protein
MGRASSKIRAGELKSLLQAVAKAGVKVTRIELNANGRIAMLTSKRKRRQTSPTIFWIKS